MFSQLSWCFQVFIAIVTFETSFLVVFLQGSDVHIIDNVHNVHNVSNGNIDHNVHTVYTGSIWEHLGKFWSILKRLGP